MMEEGTGFAAYAIYNAIHLHFSSKSYDYFKYNGKTNVSKDTFIKRKDKYYFHKLSRKYSLEELVYFYVSNFVDRGVKWVGDITGESGEETYTKWKKRNQSLTYIFDQDVDYILNQVKKPDELLVVNSGNYPKLLDIAMQGSIEVESLCILNDLMHFVPMWNTKVSDDILWPEWKRKVEKYTPFINYDKVKFKNFLKKKLSEIS